MNIYKVVGENNWEFWKAETPEEAQKLFEEYFKEKVTSCTFEEKAEDAIFRCMANGMVMRI